MSSESEDNTVAFIRKRDYILRIIVKAWRWITRSLGVIGILGGLAVEFGPANAHGGAVFRLMDVLGPTNIIVAWLMVASGVLLLFRKTALFGHILGGICYGWFGIVVIYIVYILGTESSLTAATWALGLMAVHFIAAGGRIAIWAFLRKVGQGETEVGNG